MLTTILFCAVGALAYLFIGTVIGQISWSVWTKWTYRYEEALFSLIDQRISTWIFFPLTCVEGYHLDCMLLPVGELGKNVYLLLMAVFWPIKIAWNVGVLACVLMFSLIKGLFSLLALPYDFMRKLASRVPVKQLP